MNLKSFLKLVEIQTKVASVFPFIAGNLFAWFYFKSFNVVHMLIMFGALLSIDMATTAINNYMDYKKAVKKEGYNFEQHNAIVLYNLKEKQIILTIAVLLVIGMFLGLILFLVTDWVVLLIGVLSFGVGIFYSFGPLPIYRTPFGEIFSGFFMGFFIIFLSIYIHVTDHALITLSFKKDFMSLVMDWKSILVIGLFSLPFIAGISNIMLANNICDMEDDFENKRYTLPVIIGKKKAIFIYEWTYYIMAISFVGLVVMKAVSSIYLLGFLIYLPLSKLIRDFKANPRKDLNFVNAVKGFVLTSVLIILLVMIQIIFNF
ncbi:MAG: 1,4-dihydroxy-2-naphthoate polyprenyltransferase [Clostridia bacterium]|nr:1,4-dihydroxy-2-naphthoate polyprenyltransferase [Clostridia bacterium]